MYEKEIVELQDKINVLELENSSLTEKIAHWEEELQLLDELELPDFESAEKNTAWTPMVIPEEAFQKKNVSRETISEENLLANVSRETMDSMESPTAAAVNVSRETKEEETAARQQKHIKEKIQFCRQVSELDPRRCSLLLDEILKEL